MNKKSTSVPHLKKESRSPKTVQEIKKTASRLHHATASVKGKYGSRYSSVDEENRNS